MKKVYLIQLILLLSLTSFSQGIRNNSANIVCTSSSNIILGENASWENNGTFTPSTSQVSFVGSTDQTISGSSNAAFYNLTLNKSGGDLLLSKDISVSNNLTMTAGEFDLQNSSIDLGATGVIQSETETNRIKVGDPSTNTGTIHYTRTINSVTDFDPANLGIAITTDQNLGSITVVRGHRRQQGTGSYISNYSVARYYIVPGIGEIDGSDVNVQVSYWEAELGASHPDESNLVVYQQIVEGGSNVWTPLDGAVNVANNFVLPSANPYDSYVYGDAYVSLIFNGVFTLGSTDSPLPVELLSFTAEKIGDDAVDLKWQTATEVNSDYFLVQRSSNGINWENINRVEAAGNSNSQIDYQLFDNNPLQGQSYYRLQQFDFGGAFAYSQIRTVNFDQFAAINVFPNPTSGPVYIESESAVDISVFDINGRLILQKENTNSCDLSNQAAGVYYVRISTQTSVQTEKIILK
ncbi:MAG: T9SS type A sorting domain-containing protein [Bacteroidales bacterium]|nr:T9SS type A sorting domain-containing protein [Bacteroidales bacterium]